ncbi:MAG: biotin/lipoyl-containing protein [Caldisericaceae bacterium]
MGKLLKVTVDGETFYVEIEEIQKKPTIKHIEKAEKVPQVETSAETQVEHKPESKETVSSVPVDSPEEAENNHSVKQPGDYILSPLPGKVLSVKVKEGQKVKKGDLLLMIEAMKMENEVLAAHDAVVTNVYVKSGDYVETNAKLLKIER